MRISSTRILAAAASISATLIGSSGASAQTQIDLGGGITAATSMTQPTLAGGNTIDLGSAGVTGWVTTMPMSLSYGSTNVDITFGGSAGVYYGSTPKYANSPPMEGNYFIARDTGTVTLDFSSAQRSLSMYWGTPGETNALSFYRSGQLVGSTTGAAMTPLITAAGSPTVSYPGTNVIYTQGAYTQFSFGELGFDRVVATNVANYFEFANVSFSDQPSVAPIPLNAASMGGLMSFLMMLGMWRKDGTHRMLRMMFASVAPRKRMPA